MPVEQAGRRAAPPYQPGWSVPEPAWPRTALSDRDGTDTTIRQAPSASPAVCCKVTRTRRVLDGGAVVILGVHAAGCPAWSAR